MKSQDYNIQNRELFETVKVISNTQRFRIIELTQENQLSITELCSRLKLAYNKCADYVRMLAKSGLAKKTKFGKEVRVLSKIKLYKNKIEFFIDTN